jgi:hypothetical protein
MMYDGKTGMTGLFKIFLYWVNQFNNKEKNGFFPVI